MEKLFEYGPPERQEVKRNAKGCRVTDHQKKVMLAMFAGGFLGAYGKKYKVWDRRRRPLHKLSASGFLRIKRYLRKKDGGYVLDYTAIRRLRRNTWVKKYYLTLKNKE